MFAGIGHAIGEHLGGPLGGVLGGLAGGAVGAITGTGAYTTHSNSLMAQQVPGIRNPGREGATQIRHREYIGDVKGSSGFTIQYQLPLNAAQAITFPWMSNIARQFMQYQLNGVIFEFVSTSGDATGANTGLGEIVMATNYDSVAPPFRNKQAMLNTVFSTIAKPSRNLAHAIECSPNQTTIPLLYTRPNEQPPGTDVRMFDHGVFYLATSGNQVDGQTLGELWVTYDVLLYKPLLGEGAASDNVTAPLAT